MTENMNYETDPTEGSGFWVRLWMEYGRCNTTKDETYEYLKYDDGYSDKDKDGLKAYAENWAQNDQDGWQHDRYRYGFEIVQKPPKEWLEKELVRLMKEQGFLDIKINFIKMELYK